MDHRHGRNVSLGMPDVGSGPKKFP
jgi:hypothetical protein